MIFERFPTLGGTTILSLVNGPSAIGRIAEPTDDLDSGVKGEEKDATKNAYNTVDRYRSRKASVRISSLYIRDHSKITDLLQKIDDWTGRVGERSDSFPVILSANDD
jgi:hypothetical protein